MIQEEYSTSLMSKNIQNNSYKINVQRKVLQNTINYTPIHCLTAPDVYMLISISTYMPGITFKESLFIYARTNFN